MKTLTFHIDYHTRHNEHPELACSIDGGDILYVALQSNDQTHWTATLQVADRPKRWISTRASTTAHCCA